LTSPNQTADRQRDLNSSPGNFSSFLARPAAWTLCLTFLIGLGIIRIVSTYHVFNHTIDEPSHLAAGIEWWEKGTYTIETKHTPLARISVAFLPYMAGLRAPTKFHDWTETYPILSADGHYWRNLTLARIGILPYFVICTLVVFFWTRRLYGVPAAIIASAVLTFLPTILAHSSVATTDVPFTAMFCWAMYAFTLWLKKPDAKTAAVFGFASGLALCAKFSAVAFVPGCGAAILALYALAGNPKWRALFRTVWVGLLCAFLITWAVYRFSYAPLNQFTKIPDRVAARVFGPSSGITNAVREITAKVPAPMPEIPDGIRYLMAQNRLGTTAYLFGRLKDGGFWYFFIAALAVKTPLAVLLLAAFGAGVVSSKYLRDRRNWESAAPLVSALVIIIVTMPSRIDTGVRYVLPVYVFISMLAAMGVVSLWNRGNHRTLWRAVSVALLGWMAVSSAMAHPDYLAYFNEFGGEDPSRLLVVGDLDWGQDLSRLATYLRDHNVKHISIAYDAFYDPSSLGLPDTYKLPWDCTAKASGWVAVEIRRSHLHPQCFTWLAGHRPVALVGKTMWIYYLPEDPPTAGSPNPAR
jgi:Dolichyl-phosphate-mannose-protein mannosyltransferase